MNNLTLVQSNTDTIRSRVNLNVYVIMIIYTTVNHKGGYYSRFCLFKVILPTNSRADYFVIDKQTPWQATFILLE